MLSRLGSRGSVAAAKAAFRPRWSVPTVRAAFSTVPVAKSEDSPLKPADVSMDGPLIRYGLDDWKVSLPVGLAMSVPFLANEWIVLSEEVQLLAMFVAFGTTVAKYGGAAIGKSFDDRQEAIISEINRLEEVELKMLKETVEAAEFQKSVVEDMTAINEKTLEMIAKTETVLMGQAKHKYRDQFVKWLDSAVAAEKATKKMKVDAFISKTTAQVAKNFATNPELKAAAVKQVVAILRDPKASQPDLVGAEFEKVGQQLWAEVTADSASVDSNSLISEYKAIKAKQTHSETDLDAAVRLRYQACKAGVTLP